MSDANDTGLSQDAIETMLREQVSAIFAKQKANGQPAQWGVAEHCGLIKNCLAEIGVLDKNNASDVKTIMRLLLTKGVGGNAAQFRQWDYLSDKLPAKGVKAIADMY